MEERTLIAGFAIRQLYTGTNSCENIVVGNNTRRVGDLWKNSAIGFLELLAHSGEIKLQRKNVGYPVSGPGFSND